MTIHGRICFVGLETDFFFRTFLKGDNSRDWMPGKVGFLAFLLRFTQAEIQHPFDDRKHQTNINKNHLSCLKRKFPSSLGASCKDFLISSIH